jgi:hypothetical protein
VYVRLAVAWTDPAGVSHAAGDVIDIDAITLAELEEGGVVDEIEELEPESTSSTPKEGEDGWIGPGAGKPKAESESAESTWIGPGSKDPGQQ